MCPAPLRCLEQLFVKALDSSWMCFLLQGYMVIAVRTPLSQRTTDLTQWTSIKWHCLLTQQKPVIRSFGVVSRALYLKFWGNFYFPFLWCSGAGSLFLWLLWSEDGYCHSKHRDSQQSVWSKERHIYSIFLLLQVKILPFSFQTKLWLQWVKMSRHNHLTDRMSSWHFHLWPKMSLKT